MYSSSIISVLRGYRELGRFRVPDGPRSSDGRSVRP
jgi:hypothetical protein